MTAGVLEKLRRLFYYWRRFSYDIRLAYRLMRDPRISILFKLPVIAALLYFVLPWDLLSDFFLPGVGYIDDILFLTWATRFLIRLAPQAIKQEYEKVI